MGTAMYCQLANRIAYTINTQGSTNSSHGEGGFLISSEVKSLVEFAYRDTIYLLLTALHQLSRTRWRDSRVMCARAVRLHGKKTGWLCRRIRNREREMNCSDILRKPGREFRLKLDVVAIRVFNGIEIQCGQHRRNSAPDGCVRTVSA